MAEAAVTTVYNPLFLVDFPDPCIICVDDAFYMTTTSMYYMPGIPIMRSYDLAHWEIISYVYNTFMENDAHTLQNGKNIYGAGSWATSLRHHDGWFYVCFNSNDVQDTFVFRTQDIVKGPWESARLGAVHYDPSLLFDDDGRVYIIHGNGIIRIRELTADAMAVLPGGIDQTLVETPRVDGLNCEGSHMHRIDGCYYLMLIQWPGTGTRRRIQWCYRCDTLLGAYEGKVVFDDDMGYQNNGVAQGGLVQAKDGSWYAMLFQDRGAVGRCPVLLPVQWAEGWPVLGIGGKAPLYLEVPLAQRNQVTPCIQSDTFDAAIGKLSFAWQWNHNPDNEGWSLKARPGYLRLTNRHIAPQLMQARNTLTQRTAGQRSAFWTELDTTHMREGDRAGIAAFQHRYGLVGVAVDDGKKWIIMCRGEGNSEEQIAAIPLDANTVCLKVCLDFTQGIDRATFGYALDGEAWHIIGDTLPMAFLLEHFVGYRAALFSYGTKHTGGYADFAYFSYSIDA